MTGTAAQVAPALTSDEALRIARSDAERVYSDLHLYRIEIILESDGWHIDFELKDSSLNGGGPHYVIDAATGTVLFKKYYQ